MGTSNVRVASVNITASGSGAHILHVYLEDPERELPGNELQFAEHVLHTLRKYPFVQLIPALRTLLPRLRDLSRDLREVLNANGGTYEEYVSSISKVMSQLEGVILLDRLLFQTILQAEEIFGTVDAVRHETTHHDDP
jgi:hypothetical protein